MTQTYDLDVVATRGRIVESRHRVQAAIVGRDDVLLGTAREHGATTFWRSSAKPFQLIPFVESGGLDSLDWGDDQMAISCASHGGEPEHVALVARMLRDIGLEDGDLVCGTHEPLSARGARIVRESGQRLTRLHNNCSGKHASMLAFAHTQGWAKQGYEGREHPIQQAIIGQIARWTGVEESDMEMGVDGCGVIVFATPLESMARAYARFGAAAYRGDEVPRRIFSAMTTQPFLVAGTDRLDSLLIDESHGRVVSKLGAEGVHCAAIPELGIGIAIKVEDGHLRAQAPALIRILQLLGGLPESLPPRLAELARKPLRNTRNEVTGEVMMHADFR